MKARADRVSPRAQSSRPAEFGGRGMSFNICRGTLGSLAMFTARRNASSRVSISMQLTIRNKRSAGRQPSRGRIGGVFGPRIKGNRGGRSAPMDRVDDRLEYRKTLRRQADTSADDNTGIAF
jgi:hypothetical protein